MVRGSSLARVRHAHAVLLPAALAVALAAPGCLTASQQSRLETDMADVRLQVFEMKKSTAEILTKIASMEEALSQKEGASPTRFADLEALIQSLSDQVRMLGARLDDNTARMATLAHEIALARQQYRALDARLAAALATQGLPGPGSATYPGTPGAGTEAPTPMGEGAASAGTEGGPAGAESVPGGLSPGSATAPGNTGGEEGPGTGSPVPPVMQPAPTGSPNDAGGLESTLDPADVAAQEAAFRAAYADYTRGSYETALVGFQEFLKSYPQSPLAEGAEYYAGDCLFSQQKYDEASDAFTRVIERYPASDKAPAAHLKKGLSLLALKQTARGVIQLQHVIETYPRSEEARLARERLRQLGLTVR